MDWNGSKLLIGWAAADLTPAQPVLLSGQFHVRVSEGVRDPVTATSLVLESVERGRSRARVAMVSCDLVAIPDGLRDAVRERVKRLVPALAPEDVFLNATHTHTAPEVRTRDAAEACGAMPSDIGVDLGVELNVMAPEDYVAWAAERIAEAVRRAWEGREPGAIGYGLGQATIGYNRRISYYGGAARMYGNPDDPSFSHIEGGSDSSINVLGTWNRDRRLTGVVVNVTCPSQVSEMEFQLSADFWHETRQELRRRLGESLFVLAQNSAAGDQAPAKPNTMIGWRAQERMWRLLGRSQREDIAVRIADAVEGVLPCAEKELDWNPRLEHRVANVPLSRRELTARDVEEALAEAAKLRPDYERLRAELEAHPEKRREPRWYVPITATYRRIGWNEAVAKHFEVCRTQPQLPVEIHVLRLGDVAMATNPFEYYLDYGHQIKARSKAVQTFLVQHVGFGTYLPTERAVAGRSYGAVPASTLVGPTGGRELVQWTVGTINALWE